MQTYSGITNCTAGAERGGKGTQIPWCQITMGAPNHCGERRKSQQYHKCFLQCSTFASERPQVPTWGRQSCFLPQAPTNQACRWVMPFLWESHGKRPMGWDRHKLPWNGNWTYKYVPWTTLHLTSLRLCCTGSIHETVFWLCKLPESCVSLKFSIAFLFPLLLFLSKLPSSIYKRTCNKNIFAQLSDNSRTVLTKATAFVIAEQLSRGEEIREQ